MPDNTQSGTSRPVAVITGASSGLGKDYAKQLAASGYDLLLIARRLNLLQELKTELESVHGIRVEIMRIDLADPVDVLLLENRIAGIGNLEFLVNNAGYGFETDAPLENIERECEMIRVHILAPVRLAHAALKPMMSRKKGYIINVSSVAAFLYGPGCAQYMSTKAYLLSFSKCLHCDTRGFGVYVQALCPGFVRTGFHGTELIDGEKYRKFPDFLWLKSDRVVRDSLRKVRKKRGSAVFIPSLRYKFFLGILTFPLFSWCSELIYKIRANLSRK